MQTARDWESVVQKCQSTSSQYCKDQDLEDLPSGPDVATKDAPGRPECLEW